MYLFKILYIIDFKRVIKNIKYYINLNFKLIY